jgi:hypothetical protein
VGAESICHDGHGLSNPPDLACQALAFVISSSGREDAVEGTATVAAYSNAAVDEEVMVRKPAGKGGGRGGNVWALNGARLRKNSQGKLRIGFITMDLACLLCCLESQCRLGNDTALDEYAVFYFRVAQCKLRGCPS